MARPNRSPFPADALSWLIPTRGAHVLAFGHSSTAMARRFRRQNHLVTVADPEPARAKQMGQRVTGALPVAAAAEALPFAPYSFDAVLAVQNLHEFAPGLALAEFARVLRPGGTLAVVYLVRDDAVPWVRRLMSLLRAADPDAMPGDYGSDSVSAVDASHYFPTVEHRSFRMWFPVSRIGLMEMVARSSSARRLGASRLNQLITEVGQLYDGSARAPEPLLLPYRIACTRARVDHAEFTSPLTIPDDALRISL